MSIDYSSPVGLVRLLLNDVDANAPVFSDAEITALLTLEHGSVKRAAAQAIDSQATNEALALKVLKDHQVTTDGAKLADAMRKHADSLRQQARDDEDDEAFYVDVFDVTGGDHCRPERTAGW